MPCMNVDVSIVGEEFVYRGDYCEVINSIVKILCSEPVALRVVVSDESSMFDDGA